MPVTQSGVVYYQDDPTQSPFRTVYAQYDDSELDDPMWVTVGVDPNRVAVMKKVPVGQAAVMPWSTPWSTPDENVAAAAAAAAAEVKA